MKYIFLALAIINFGFIFDARHVFVDGINLVAGILCLYCYLERN